MRNFEADETKNLLETNLVFSDESSRKDEVSGQTVLSLPEE